jgi:hypothetical protein
LCRSSAGGIRWRRTRDKRRAQIECECLRPLLLPCLYRQPFFEQTLRAVYEALCASPPAALHLNGVFRFQGYELDGASMFQLEDVVMTSREAAHLLMVFDGSRVSEQEQHDFGVDDAPPGTYFTIINREVIHEGHKNRIGIYMEEGDGASLYLGEDADPGQPDENGPPVELSGDGRAEPVRAVHVDHLFLRRQAPDYLGTVSFALCAIVAHRLGLTHISLIAGGGLGHNANMIGYFF